MTNAASFALDPAEMTALAEAHAQEYQSAEPFPSIVIDDFLPQVVLRDLIDNYPSVDNGIWHQFNDPREVKFALADETVVPPPLRAILRELNGHVFVDFLERLTGIGALVPDPHFVGGGLHQILPGGLLKVHADFDMHPRLHMHRRLNALLYLNEDWQESYGGYLELWDVSMSHAVRRIAPIANRLVVFSTTDTSYHGHPEALTCPAGRARRSLAWYYYTAPVGVRRGHDTLFKDRPGERVYSATESFRNRVYSAIPPSAKQRVNRLLGRT